MKKIITMFFCLLSGVLVYSQSSWTLQPNVPGPGREAANMFVVDGKIYVGGGLDSAVSLQNDFYQYDPATNVWTKKANLPDHIGGSSCFTLNGKGYMACGENQTGVPSSNYQYDPVADKWNTMSPFPGQGRLDGVGFTIGNTGYLFGGHAGGGEVNDLWAYNPNTDSWTQKASMPSNGRSGPYSFVIDSIAYIGLGEYNSSANYATDFFAYNPTTNTWTTIAQFPGHYRSGGFGYTLGKFGYVALGGYIANSAFYPTNDIYQYTPGTNTWTTAGAFPGLGRGNSAFVNVGNIIYTGTGEATPKYFNDWWQFIYQVSVTIPSGQTVCSGSQIILDAITAGGIAPITYSWASTGDSLSCYTCQYPSVIITKSDTFIISVSDANNTIASDTVTYGVSVNQGAIQLSASNTNISCQNSTDTTMATVNGGTMPYFFQWGDGTSGYDISPSTHLFTHAGVYVLTAADSFGCATSIFDTVVSTTVTVSLANSVTPICLYDSTGKIFLKVTGGTPPYTYKWTNGSASDSLTHVAAGDYSVTVTDTTGCSAEFFYELNTNNDNWGYYVYLNATDPNCINDGSISTNVYGGSAPYSFIWNDSATTPNIQNLAAGTYNVTVTDSIGCPRRASATLSFNCNSLISGYAFVDTNNNCVLDPGEDIIVGALVTAYNNNVYYYGYTDWNGFYIIEVPDTGTYNMQISGLNGFCANINFCTNVNQTVTIGTLGQSSNLNNFVANFAAGFDLTIHPGWTSADPGFEKEYWVMPYDQSISPFNGTATVTFAYDPNLVYVASDTPHPVHDPVAHTLTWTTNYIPLPIWDWDNARFITYFHVPDTLDVGYQLQSDFYITPTEGDCDSSNNHLHFSETVIGSHDPNEKIADPVSIDPNDSVITYSIHFQNTGTDSTHFIVVVDTLSPYLDPTTVKNLASSSPYSSFTINGQRKAVLTWTFNPLALPDSLTNAQASKGFVTFSVQKIGNLALGTTINNTADIYFDYNSGVVTNTVTTTVALATGVKNQVGNTINVRAYPNPFSNYTQIVVEGLKDKYDFELFNVTGQMERRISSIQANQFTLNRDELAAGMYFYRISVTGKEAAYGKIIVE